MPMTKPTDLRWRLKRRTVRLHGRLLMPNAIARIFCQQVVSWESQSVIGEGMSNSLPLLKLFTAILTNSYVCHVDRSSLSAAAQTSLSQQTIFATPVSRALPRIRLRTRQAPTLIDQKILVSMDRWLPTSRYPDGHFVKALGKVGSKEAEQESLLLEYEVPYRPFGKAILGCLPAEGDSWKVPVKSADSLEWRDREDLRELIVCSIDPPGQSFASVQTVRQIVRGS